MGAWQTRVVGRRLRVELAGATRVPRARLACDVVRGCVNVTDERIWITGTDGTWALQAPHPDDNAVRLWTTTRTPFETEQSPEQKLRVHAVAQGLSQLRFSPGDGLHASFACDQVGGRQPDAENITLYNTGTAPFTRCIAAPFTS